MGGGGSVVRGVTPGVGKQNGNRSSTSSIKCL